MDQVGRLTAVAGPPGVVPEGVSCSRAPTTKPLGRAATGARRPALFGLPLLHGSAADYDNHASRRRMVFAREATRPSASSGVGSVTHHAEKNNEIHAVLVDPA